MELIKDLLLRDMKAIDGSIQWQTYVAVVCLLKDMYKAVKSEDINDGVLNDWASDIADQVMRGIDHETDK